MGIGERLRRLSTRLAGFTFGLSVAMFEARLLTRLSRLKDRAIAFLERNRRPGRSAIDAAPDRRGQSAEPRAALVGTSAAMPGLREGVPIVLIHENDSPHLIFALAQARKSNPNSSVFLLGDAANDRYPGVEHRYFRDYFDGASQFARVYQHYSTHSVSFELMCFQRWFILAEFLRANEIEKCVYLDSDVLLYANVTDDMKKFDRFDFTLCWNTIGCTFFLNKLAGLDDLCRFMMNIYAKRDLYHFDKMVAQFAVRQRHRLPGGASDMTALELYEELNFGRVGEASHIIDGSVYDPNINMPHPGFEMENNIKKIVWEDDHPYGTFLATGEKVRFNSLHFNGRVKSLMGQYCTARLTQPQQIA